MIRKSIGQRVNKQINKSLSSLPPASLRGGEGTPVVPEGPPGEYLIIATLVFLGLKYR
jgi:hypothetical protein